MALSADRNTPYKVPEEISVPVAASTKIYGGALVVANASGYAAGGSTAATLTYLGRAEEKVDNSAGANGAKSVRVARGKAFKFKNSDADPVTQASLGKSCYIVDDETVAATSDDSARSAAGIVLGIESDGVWVL